MTARLLFHLGAAGMYWGTIWYDIHHINLGPALGWDAYGGKLRFLTFINLTLHAIFFALCTVYDFAQILRMSSRRLAVLRGAKDHMFTVLVFPVGAFVCLMFWAIYIFDRELIFPQFLDDLFLAWANHVMHTAILPVALIEMALDYHAHPRSRWHGLRNLVFFSLAYQAWTLWIYYRTSKWIYPIFNVLNGWQKVVFMQIATVCILALYFIGESLQRMLHGRKSTPSPAKLRTSSSKNTAKPASKKKL